MKGWPFLVSRNQYIDYRTVVAPDFICNAGVSYILARTESGDLTNQGEAFFRTIEGSNAGSFTMVYQVVEATEQDKDINSQGGNAVLKDSFGREIYLIKGFVLNGKHSYENTKLYQKNIDKSYDYSVESYRKFWKNTDSDFQITSSEEIDLEKGNQPLHLRELPSFKFKPEPEPINLNLRIVIIVALLIILGIILTSLSPKIFSRQPNTPDTKVSVYKQNLKTRHLYLDITGKWASDGSDASGRYWFIGKEGGNFIVTNDGKSIYKTGEQIIVRNLIPIIDDKVATNFKEKSINLKNENPSKALKEVQKRYKDAAIYISGSLQVNSPDEMNKLIEIKPNQYQTLIISNSKLRIDYYPIEQAIINLQNQVVTGNITLMIIQPKPNF